MLSVTKDLRVNRMLELPREARKGQIGYLVDQWWRIHERYKELQAVSDELERRAAEARTQSVKAMGALEVLEKMLSEHESIAPKPSEPLELLKHGQNKPSVTGSDGRGEEGE